MTNKKMKQKKLKYVVNSETVDRFSKTRKDNTAKIYRYSLERFFDFKKIYPDEYIDPERDIKLYKQDMTDYIKYMEKEKYSPVTMHKRTCALKLFLEEFEIDFKPGFLRQMSNMIGKREAQTQDRTPSPEQLKKLLIHAPLLVKAIFFIPLTSGMRIGEEVLNLTFSDLQYLDEDPPRIFIRREIAKGNYFRTTFISQEAKSYINDWLKHRDAWIITAIKKSYPTRKYYMKKGFQLTKQKNGEYIVTKDGKNVDITKHDQRVFPFSYNNALCMWNAVLQKAGFDQRDNNTKKRIHIYHSYVLRKNFNTVMIGEGVPQGLVDHFMGHQTYLSKEYNRFEDNPKEREKAINHYKRAIHALTIFDGDGEELKSMEEKAVKHEHIIAEQRINDSENSKEIQKLKEELKKINKRFDDFMSENEDNMKKIRIKLNVS